MVNQIDCPRRFTSIVQKNGQQSARTCKFTIPSTRAVIRPVGKISVDYVPPKDKEARAADKAGEFIDYEEVKQ